MNAHGAGSVKAGDRVPEITVRYRGSDWSAARLLTLLDPSGFTLIVAHGNQGDWMDPTLVEAVDQIHLRLTVVEIAPSPGISGEGYKHLLGGESNILLVRPDGYVAVAASAKAAPEALGKWFSQWTTAAGAESLQKK